MESIARNISDYREENQLGAGVHVNISTDMSGEVKLEAKEREYTLHEMSILLILIDSQNIQSREKNGKEKKGRESESYLTI